MGAEIIKQNTKKKFIIFLVIITILTFLLINPLTVKTFYSKDRQLSFGTNYVLTFLTILLLFLLSFYFLNLILIKKGKLKIPNITIKISTVFFIFLTIIAIFELIFRTFLSSLVPIQLYSYNKYFDMTWHKPNLSVSLKTSEYNVRFQTNNIGLRDNREWHRKNTNEINILALGDSMIQAAQVEFEQTMSFILENRLNSLDTEKKFRIINLGTSGCDTSYQRLFLEKNLDKFEADLLLLFVFIGNDIIISETIEKSGLSKITKAFNSFITNFKRFSKFFTFIIHRISMTRHPLGRICQPFDERTNDKSINIFLKEYNEKIKNAYSSFQNELIKIENLCEKKHIRFIIFLVPTKEQVDPSKLNEVIKFYKIDQNLLDIEKPQRLIEEFLKNNRIEYFDLLKPLYEETKIEKTYFNLDPHWNEHGNKTVADIVFNYLKNTDLSVNN